MTFAELFCSGGLGALRKTHRELWQVPGQDSQAFDVGVSINGGYPKMHGL